MAQEPSSSGGNQPEVVRHQEIRIVTGPIDGIPLQFVNHVICNFVGNQFILTLMQAVPPPFVGHEEVPSIVEAKVVGRFAFTVPTWVSTVRSLTGQLQRLEEQSALDFKAGTTGESDARKS